MKNVKAKLTNDTRSSLSEWRESNKTIETEMVSVLNNLIKFKSIKDNSDTYKVTVEKNEKLLEIVRLQRELIEDE